MEVHRQLGNGFLEAVYQEALAQEFENRQIPFRREVDLPIAYKGLTLKTAYRADFICNDSIIVELKALASLTPNEAAQIINYMKASRCEIGMLVNFGAVSLEYRRFAASEFLKTN